MNVKIDPVVRHVVTCWDPMSAPVLMAMCCEQINTRAKLTLVSLLFTLILRKVPDRCDKMKFVHLKLSEQLHGKGLCLFFIQCKNKLCMMSYDTCFVQFGNYTDSVSEGTVCIKANCTDTNVVNMFLMIWSSNICTVFKYL